MLLLVNTTKKIQKFAKKKSNFFYIKSFSKFNEIFIVPKILDKVYTNFSISYNKLRKIPLKEKLQILEKIKYKQDQYLVVIFWTSCFYKTYFKKIN